MRELPPPPLGAAAANALPEARAFRPLPEQCAAQQQRLADTHAHTHPSPRPVSSCSHAHAMQDRACTYKDPIQAQPGHFVQGQYESVE